MISRKVHNFTNGNLWIYIVILCLDCAGPHPILLHLCVPPHLPFYYTAYLPTDMHLHCLPNNAPRHLILLFLCVPAHLHRLLRYVPIYLRLLLRWVPPHLCLLQCCVPLHLCYGSPADLRIEPNYQPSKSDWWWRRTSRGTRGIDKDRRKDSIQVCSKESARISNFGAKVGRHTNKKNYCRSFKLFGITLLHWTTKCKGGMQRWMLGQGNGWRTWANRK